MSQSSETRTVTLTDNATGQSWEFPVLPSTLGPDLVDLRRLYAETGMFSYDPGYASTGSCSSTITFVDGNKGELLYRGYPIEELAEHSDFEEVSYLLLNGELPSAAELADFHDKISHHTMLHEQIATVYRGFRRDAHPMAIMVGVVGALSAFYHDSTNIYDHAQRRISAHRLIAKMPTIAAWAYKYSQGQPFQYPQNHETYAGNFYRMMFETPCERWEGNPVVSGALDKILILHADHEQNASTSTVRLAGSSGADPFACIASGIASLWGPAHGGANEAVLRMLQEIEHKDNIPRFLERAKDKDDPFRLMGFGHRVYKNYDPRAKVLSHHAHAVLKDLGVNDPLLELAMELERIALEDDYFVERKLYPNVDFYSGIIFKAMGIPTSMFTVIFAVARTVGWISQWKEMIQDPEMRIGRPRQRYLGAQRREYVPVDQRG